MFCSVWIRGGCWCYSTVDLALDPTISFHIGHPCYGLHYRIGRIPNSPHCKTPGCFETCPSAHQTDPLHPLNNNRPWTILYHQTRPRQESQRHQDSYAEAVLPMIGHFRGLPVLSSPLNRQTNELCGHRWVVSACLTSATLSSRSARASQTHRLRRHLYDTSEGPVFVAWNWRVALWCKDIRIEPGATKRCLPFPFIRQLAARRGCRGFRKLKFSG